MSAYPASLPVACFAIAWRNLAQHVTRSLTALLGTALAVFLLFFQIGFLDSAERKAVQLYDVFDFDLAVVSQFYQLMYGAPSFDVIRLAQIRVDDAVDDVFSLNIRISKWTSAETAKRSSAMLIGLDDKPEFIRDDAVRGQLPRLRDRGQVLVDAFAHDDYGSRAIGSRGWIRGAEATVAGQFDLGLFFYADGSVMVANAQYPAYAGRDSRQTTIGLVKIAPGADAVDVRDRLRLTLPRDVVVLTRAELIAQEQNYFVSVKPIGVMIRAGMIVALIVGAVILYQVLSTEIALRMGEFAIMKAMGFGRGFVYGIGIIQILIFAVTGYVIAGIAAYSVFMVVRDLVHLDMRLDAPLAAVVLTATILMCLVSGYVTLRRVEQADPADLY